MGDYPAGPRRGLDLAIAHYIYLKAGNTLGLHEVYSTLAGFDAKVPAAKINLAAVSLRLYLQPAKARALARH